MYDMEWNSPCTKRAWIVFLTMVILFSAAVEAWIDLGGSTILYLVLMWIPAFAAIIASILSQKEKGESLTGKQFLARLGFRKCRLRYILLAMLIPLIYLLIPYMVYWKLHPENFAYTGVSLWLILKDIAPVMIIGVFSGLISATGEEIGWRGFMLPNLIRKRGLRSALLVTSIFWACWHLPLLIGGDYMAGAPVWFKLPAFVLCIVPVGIIIGILTFLSSSVWPAAFLHAAHNNYDQAVFGVITRGDDQMFYVSETGVVTILCAWIIAVIMILYVKKKNASD